jgi:hypothetical protein
MYPSMERKILILIEAGKCQKDILAAMKSPSKSTLCEWMRRLEFEQGYICTTSRSSVKCYTLTQKGRQRLKELRSSETLGDPDQSELPPDTLLFSLHHYKCTYPVLKRGTIFDPNPTQMTNWVRERVRLPNATVETNGLKSITITPSFELRGENQALLVVRAQAICDSAAELMEAQFGFVLGRGKLGDVHMEASSEAIREMAREVGYVKDHMDASSMGGELVYRGRDGAKVAGEAQGLKEAPRKLDAMRGEVAYLRERVSLMEGSIMSLIDVVDGLKGAVDGDARAHQALVDALNNLSKSNGKYPQDDKDVPGYG